MRELDYKEINKKIELIQKAAKDLQENSHGVQSIERNVDRILASVHSLKINVSDVVDILNINKN